MDCEERFNLANTHLLISDKIKGYFKSLTHHSVCDGDQMKRINTGIKLSKYYVQCQMTLINGLRSDIEGLALLRLLIYQP